MCENDSLISSTKKGDNMIFKKKHTVDLDEIILHRLIETTYFYTATSAAKIQNIIIDTFGITFEQAPSTRYIEKVIHDKKKENIAEEILEKIDTLAAPKINTLCGDELCSPAIIYTSVEPNSGYAINLDVFHDHSRGKADVWQQCFAKPKKLGLSVHIALCDQAAGTLKGHKDAFKDAYVFADFFHIYYNFREATYKAQRDLNNLTKENDKIQKIRVKRKLEDDHACLQLATDYIIRQAKIKEEIVIMTEVSENLKIMLSWLFGYILTLAGDNIDDRSELYDFIVDGVQSCALLTMKTTLDKIAQGMRSQKAKLLYFLKYLDDQFNIIVEENKDTETPITNEQVWLINKYLQYSENNPHAAELALSIIKQIGLDKFDEVKSKLAKLHANTCTYSSYAENFIGRIKPFMSKHKKLYQGLMNRFRLFINCSHIHSSRTYEKRSQTPTEILLGKEFDKHWIDYFYPKPVLKHKGIPINQDNVVLLQAA
jgi:hypothetical protein